MTHIERHALVMHSAKRMFELVDNVAAYPKMFDWCESAQVLESSASHRLARLDVRRGAMRTSFTTRNEVVIPTRIQMRLVEGRFKELEGLWQFHALDESSCKVQLSLSFETSGSILGAAMSMGMKKIADRMVDDFCQAADRLYADPA